MLHQYSRKKRKQLELYFRCLSTICTDSVLGHYYYVYEFHKAERWLRKQVMKNALLAWNITDAASFKSTIRWLLDDGYRDEYRQIHAHLSALTDASRKRYMETSTNHPDYARRAVVDKFLPQLPSGDIAAFGGGWAIFLSRIGPVYGYVTSETAWKTKIEIARRLQSHYNNWEDYMTAFAAGYAFSQSDPEMKKARHIFNGAMSLFASNTLVDKVVWHQNLLPDKGESLHKQGKLSI
ncbi:DUF1266 domain-containing protein [Siminovitchia sp. FSL H7-0308]|uniref:DUF1266 domain-containing protein n=1 Tax=unclassified Siminovitchia TaxID=2837530 RepID=UPI0030CF740C